MLKRPLTFDEQIEQLRMHGIIVSDESRTKEQLARVSYSKDFLLQGSKGSC